MQLKMKKTLSPYSPASAPKRAEDTSRNALSDVLPLFSNVGSNVPNRTNDDTFAPPPHYRIPRDIPSEKT